MTDTELAHRMANILEKTGCVDGWSLSEKIMEAFPEPPTPKNGEWWIGTDSCHHTCVKCYNNNNWYASTDLTSPYPFTFIPIRKMQKAP
jgi:hypothetical protein